MDTNAFKRFLECSVKMMETNLEANSEKMSKEAIEYTKNSINETKRTLKQIEEGTFVIPKEFEPTRNNRFKIEVTSDVFSPKDYQISFFYQNPDNFHKIELKIIETLEDCLPLILEKCIEKATSFTIKKTITSAKGHELYSVIYKNCYITDYEEPALNYNDDGIRTFKVVFDYKNYDYETKD